MFGSPTETRKITLDLLRHGEPEGGVRYRGSIDDPLSATGWQQMRHATAHAMAPKTPTPGTTWNTIISSPMRRCQEYARELADQCNLPISIEPDLKELCFGDLEGLTPRQAWEQHPQLLQALWQDPEQTTPPGGEPYREFMQRVAGCLERIIHARSAKQESKHYLLVIHGGVIRATLSHFLNIAPADSFRIEVPYAGITRLKLYIEADGTYNAALSFINRFTGDS